MSLIGVPLWEKSAASNERNGDTISIEFLWKLATEHSLPQAMYNSIAKSIKTQSSTPSVNIAQPITITMGDVIIKGNADKQTVADIKKQQENTVRMVLQKIKELQK